jgi:molybdopterin molybdotransferase
MTGAPVPAGFDAVVPVEQVDILQRDATGRPCLVALHAPAVADQNIRHAGTDFQPGDTIAAAGARLGAEHVMAIAATGVTGVSVRPAPRVAVIATGAELVDDPTLPLGPGQIRDSNNPYLQSMLPALGAELVYTATLGDDPAAFAAALADARALAPDLILTSGAVSAGVHDFIPAALHEAGAEVHFHKSQVRPGKPILFATLGSAIVFGLPGNPLSVAVGLRFFVTPALRRAQGLPPESWPLARLANDWRKPAQMTFFGKGVVCVDAQGCLQAAMLPGQESYRIAPLAQANAWLVLPAGAAEVAAGSLVSVAPMLPGSWRL